MVTAITLTAFPFLVRPFSQQSNDNSPSPQPFTFFILPETSTFSEPTIPILVAVILPSELSQNYQLSDFFVISEGLFVPTFPLFEEPFFDSETNSFVWLFAGLFDASESNRAPAQYPFSLFAYAFFEPVIPSLPTLSSFAQVSFSVSPSSYAVEPVELCPGPEICIEYFGIECTCPLPGDETTPPDGGTTPPDSGTNPPDEDDEPPPSPCGGISYAIPFPRLSGYIVEPVGEEVIVIAGDTLNLRANGSPNPDLDQTISIAPDPKSGECSSSEKIIPGPPLSFIWRLWEDTDRDGKPNRLIGNIGYGKQISWRVPERAGVYFVELVVDDDGNPDKESPPEKVECAKCTAYSTADDPAVRDWVKVKVKDIQILLTIRPEEPATLSADDQEAFIVVGVWVYDPENPEAGWQAASDGTQVTWELIGNHDGSLSPTTSTTEEGFAVTKLITNRKAGASYQVQGTVTNLVYQGCRFLLRRSITSAPITVIPGQAQKAWLNTDQLYLPADERSTAFLPVKFFDAWGNLVNDGLSSSASVEGLSRILSWYIILPLSSDGSTFIPVRSGGSQHLDTFSVRLDAAQTSIPLTLVPLQVQVTVSTPQLTVAAGQTATVIAQVKCGDQPAPDGTPVYWLSSAGSISPSPSYTKNGIATAQLSTASLRDNQPTPLHEWVGDVLVVATVPGHFSGSAYVRFERNPNALLLAPQHRILAGDVNGFQTPTVFEQVEQIDGTFKPIECEATTPVTIYGAPNETVIVSVDNPSLALLRHSNALGQSIMVTLDSEGEGQVELISTGELKDFQAIITLTVQHIDEGPPNSMPLTLSQSQQRSFSTKVVLVPKKTLAVLKDFALGFFLGGNDNLTQMVGDFIAGLLIFGDIRDLALNLWAFILPGGEEADWVVVGFACLGLILNLQPELDLFVTAGKTVFKILRPLGKAGQVFAYHLCGELKHVWQNRLWHSAEGQRLFRLLKSLATQPAMVKFVVHLANDEEVFHGLLRIAHVLDDAAISALNHRLEQLAGNPQIGLGAVKKAVMVVKGIGSDDVVRHLLTPQDNFATIEFIAKIMAAGKVNEKTLSRVLGQDLFTETYTRKEFLEDLARVKDASKLETVLKHMTNPVYSFAKGALYEIWVGSRLQEKGYGRVLEFRKYLYPTDTDIVLEGSEGKIFVQAKSGRFIYNGDDKAVYNKIEQEWGSLLAKYREGGASKIICVFGDEVDSRLVKYLKGKGVIVLYGDEWKYPGK